MVQRDWPVSTPQILMALSSEPEGRRLIAGHGSRPGHPKPHFHIFFRGWPFTRSILGRSFHAIDHQRLHLALRRLQPQPQRLQRREDRFIC